jgi:hypothetical protein
MKHSPPLHSSHRRTPSPIDWIGSFGSLFLKLNLLNSGRELYAILSVDDTYPETRRS